MIRCFEQPRIPRIRQFRPVGFTFSSHRPHVYAHWLIRTWKLSKATDAGYCSNGIRASPCTSRSLDTHLHLLQTRLLSQANYPKMRAENLPKFKDMPVVEGMPPGTAWGLWDKNGEQGRDNCGSLNLLTPENTINAKKEIRIGKTIALKYELHSIPGHFQRGGSEG